MMIIIIITIMIIIMIIGGRGDPAPVAPASCVDGSHGGHLRQVTTCLG